MAPFFRWFSRRSAATSSPADTAITRPDVLEQARALARAGKTMEASSLYWKVKRKQHTVASLLEHADLLFELGDDFGAAAKASDALQLEPGNSHALSIQARIRAHDGEDR
ncbi:MAG: hypothetical protein KDC14_16730 [Planctomycetes bacterium]|nr:hypothetical protein [Planctomycetota bacterium]